MASQGRIRPFPRAVSGQWWLFILGGTVQLPSFPTIVHNIPHLTNRAMVMWQKKYKKIKQCTDIGWHCQTVQLLGSVQSYPQAERFTQLFIKSSQILSYSHIIIILNVRNTYCNSNPTNIHVTVFKFMVSISTSHGRIRLAFSHTPKFGRGVHPTLH